MLLVVNTVLKSEVNLKVFIQYFTKKSQVNLTNIFEIFMYYRRRNINPLILCTESIDSAFLTIIKLHKVAKNSDCLIISKDKCKKPVK